MNTTELSEWIESQPNGTKMSILGPPKTFTEKAARMLLQDSQRIELEYQDSMWDIHNAVHDQGHLGLLALRNYSSGHEPDNLEGIFNEEWIIHAEVMAKIGMVLGGPGKPLFDAVTDVYSKDVGLRQCSSFIRQHFPHASRHSETSTVAAIEKVAKSGNPGAVAIGSKQAHITYGNTIWAEGISNAELNGHNNVTHFIVVSRADIKRTLDGSKKHHGLILTPKDQDGVSSIATRIFTEGHMGLESQTERAIGLMKYRFFYLMQSALSSKEKLGDMLQNLEQHLEPANGRYPLVQPISSWNIRVYDEAL